MIQILMTKMGKGAGYFMGFLDLNVLSSTCELPIQINRSLFSKQIHFMSQDLCRLLEVLQGDIVVVAHVEGVGVALGHLLLQLLVREAEQLEHWVWGGGGGG